jgi:hypothetical protein
MRIVPYIPLLKTRMTGRHAVVEGRRDLLPRHQRAAIADEADHGPVGWVIAAPMAAGTP